MSSPPVLSLVPSRTSTAQQRKKTQENIFAEPQPSQQDRNRSFAAVSSVEISGVEPVNSSGEEQQEDAGTEPEQYETAPEPDDTAPEQDTGASEQMGGEAAAPVEVNSEDNLADAEDEGKQRSER